MTKITNWAYPDTIGGNANKKCFGEYSKENNIVVIYLRLLSEEAHEGTEYQDYGTDFAIPKELIPKENIYHVAGNIHNNRNVVVQIDKRGRILARLDTKEKGSINTYTTIVYHI